MKTTLTAFQEPMILWKTVLRVAVGVVILVLPEGKIHAQGEIERSIHEMEWSANKDRVSRDERAPSDLMRMPLVKKPFELLRRKVIGYHPHWADDAYHAYDFQLLSTVVYFSCDVDTATGKPAAVYSWPTTNLVNVAHAAGVKVVLAAANFGANRNAAVLRSPGKRAMLIQSLVQLVTRRAAEGVHIDFEGVAEPDRGNLVIFMNDLSSAFHEALPDPEVSMALPAVDWTNAYDVALLGKACDYLILMGYDFHYSASPVAGAVAPLAGEPLNVRRAVSSYLAQALPPDRLVLGVPYYGYDWPTKNGDMNSRTTGRAERYPITYSAHNAFAAERGKLWDPATSSPWYKYPSGTQWHQAWFDDSSSLSRKYLLSDSLGLGGIGIWALSYDAPHDELWKCLRASFAIARGNFRYADFRSTAGLTLLGGATQCENRICLSSSSGEKTGGLWYMVKQSVQDTFVTSFRFSSIGHPQESGNTASAGFAFVIHNCGPSTPGGSGATSAFADDHSVPGLINSLTVEFDVRQDSVLVRKGQDRVNVQIRGRDAKSSTHRYLPGPASSLPDLVDGGIHTITIHYAGGRLSVYVDEKSSAFLDAPLEIAQELVLDNGNAWVGFTGSAASTAETIDLLSWTFTGAR